jgi:hypothetical protein
MQVEVSQTKDRLCCPLAFRLRYAPLNASNNF